MAEAGLKDLLQLRLPSAPAGKRWLELIIRMLQQSRIRPGESWTHVHWSQQRPRVQHQHQHLAFTSQMDLGLVTQLLPSFGPN